MGSDSNLPGTGSPAGGDTRDRLAVQRTHLANERTLLAYARTALMLASSGAAVLKFFPDFPGASVGGWGLVAGGAMLGGWGLSRFIRMKGQL